MKMRELGTTLAIKPELQASQEKAYTWLLDGSPTTQAPAIYIYIYGN